MYPSPQAFFLLTVHSLWKKSITFITHFYLFGRNIIKAFIYLFIFLLLSASVLQRTAVVAQIVGTWIYKHLLILFAVLNIIGFHLFLIFLPLHRIANFWSDFLFFLFLVTDLYLYCLKKFLLFSFILFIYLLFLTFFELFHFAFSGIFLLKIFENCFQ